jgi:hypothetical protein
MQNRGLMVPHMLLYHAAGTTLLLLNSFGDMAVCRLKKLQK